MTVRNTNTTSMSDTNSNTLHAESHARIIDSHDLTTDSTVMIDMIDKSLSHQEMSHVTNTSSAGGLADSQIAILHQVSQKQKNQDEDVQPHMDEQNRIYSNPVNDEKLTTPLTLDSSTLLENASHLVVAKSNSQNKSKLISHSQFKLQLKEAASTRAALQPKSVSSTIDSRISKKQRFPPELIKYKLSTGGSSYGVDGCSQVSKVRRASNEFCSVFPLQVVLGTLQLILSISLVALGSLLIAREASLSISSCGIWTGIIAAVTGSMGVIGMRKTQTAFLALSLICIATSTLALAISGVGLWRDFHELAVQNEQFDLINAKSEVSAQCSLIFGLFIHFAVSIVSVYRCVLQICTK